MNKMALARKTDYPLGLTKEIEKNLETWEDHVSYYVQLSEASNSFSWIKADILLHLAEKFGDSSIEKISNDIGEAPSTVANYVRVARAFPPKTRDPILSFSHHYNASFADSYDESRGEFVTENRFGWVERAANENLSTRRLREEIKDDKDTHGQDETFAPNCDFCGTEGHNVKKHVFWCPGGKSVKFMLHPDCFEDIIRYVESQGK